MMAQEKSKGKKIGLFSRLFPKNSKKEIPEKMLQANAKVSKGKVKEIIVESPLEKKFMEQRGLSLKIPSAPFNLSAKIPKAPEKNATESEKQKRLNQKRFGKKLSLLIISSEEYLKSIAIILKYATGKYQKILYISLNELYGNLIRNLENSDISLKKFYFIDAITRTAQTNIEETDNCTFVTSPNSLVELSLAITQKIEEMEPDLIIFDSLSTLFIYENDATAVKFTHSLIGKMKAAGCDSILTALEGDASRKAIKDLGMFVDEFLTMPEYQLQHFEFGIDKKPIIPKQTPKEQALKKEMDSIFPQRKTQPAQLEIQKKLMLSQKKLILSEMGKLKENLRAIKKEHPAKESLARLEKKIQSIEKKPVLADAEEIHKEIESLAKKTELVKNGIKDAPPKMLESALESVNTKIAGIEKKLEAKVPPADAKKARRPEKQKIIAKEKIKKALAAKKQSETKMNSLEKKFSALERKYGKGKINNQAFEKERQKVEKMLKK